MTSADLAVYNATVHRAATAERQLAAALVRIRTLEATVRTLVGEQCEQRALDEQTAAVDGTGNVVAMDAWRGGRG